MPEITFLLLSLMPIHEAGTKVLNKESPSLAPTSSVIGVQKW